LTSPTAPLKAVPFDIGVNLKPAKAMGMRTIAVNSPGQALGKLGGGLGLQFG
jgi:hypothetical protein